MLYELVAPEGTVVPKGGPDRNRNALSMVQNAMKDLLDLEYQLSGIDYTKKNRPPGVDRPISIVDTSKGIKVVSELLKPSPL